MPPGSSIDTWEVLSCTVGFRVDVEFISSQQADRRQARLSLGGRFALIDGAGSIELDADTRNEDLAPVLRLIGKRVSACVATESGSLLVDFDGGLQLLVEPDSKYEAWELHSPDEALVSVAGGGLAIWDHSR